MNRGQVTEILGSRFSRERRVQSARAKCGELDYGLEGRDPVLPSAPAFAGVMGLLISASGGLMVLLNGFEHWEEF